MLDTVWQDLRHGTRMLAKNPGFAIVAMASIAIGVGANAAMFSIADGLIFRPLPVPDARTLVVVSATTPTGDIYNSGPSYPDYVDLRDSARSFESLAAAQGVVTSVAANRDQPAQGTFGLAVSGNFFDVLRVQPALGRALVPDEDRVPGRDAVVVLAHDTWAQQFGADPAVVGRPVRLGGLDFTVVGVTPEGFTGIDIYLPPAFYVPLAMLPALDPSQAEVLERRDLRVLSVIGRLEPGVSMAQAREEVDLLASALERAHPETNQSYGLLVRTERETRFDEFAPAFGLGVMLITLAIAVLLVACANVAGLLTSRAPARARELAVHLAMGGGRGRLVRQLITEAVLIATAGGALGLVLAYVGVRSFRQFQIVTDVPVRLTYALDRRAVVVGLAVAAVSALLASLVPAWRSARTIDLSRTLRNTPASHAPRLWGRYGLVAAQIACTLLVLTVAASFYRAFEAEYGEGPGFRTDHLLLATLDPELARYDARQSQQFYRRLEERVRAIPGVSSVGTTTFVPLSFEGSQLAVVPDGVDLPPGVSGVDVAAARVDEDYFDAIGTLIVSGRRFEARDTADAPRVAIVSRGTAARYWPDEDPLGKRIRLTASNEWVEVVGVAADSKFAVLSPASTPFLYLPQLQHPTARTTLLVRTDGEPASLAAPLRAAIGEIDPDVPIVAMRTMEDVYQANAKNLNTVVVRTVAGMGTMGLALALIGLYGLMAYAVSRRTREIGIRIAVGATPGSILWMILRQGSAPAAAGLVMGTAASVAAGRAMQGLFPGTGGNLSDSVTFLLVIPLVMSVVMIAAYIPARRAGRIDPLAALRQE